VGKHRRTQQNPGTWKDSLGIFRERAHASNVKTSMRARRAGLPLAIVQIVTMRFNERRASRLWQSLDLEPGSRTSGSTEHPVGVSCLRFRPSDTQGGTTYLLRLLC
jgi:hypothetical protein